MFFLKSHTQNVVEKLDLDSLKKKKKLRISLDQQFGHLYSLFLLYAQDKDYQNILKLKC